MHKVVLCLSVVLASWLLPPEGRAQQAKGGKVDSQEALEGHVYAPEFPEGVEWLNTPAPLRLRDLRGKFVLLDFWTFCCINCMHIILDLRKLETKYEQELVVIGVHSAKFQNEKDTGQIRQAILRYEIQHPVVNDASFEIWKRYGARAWPTLVLINPKGKILGMLSAEGIYEPLDLVLQKAIPYFESRHELKRSPAPVALEEARRANTLLAFPGKIAADRAHNRLAISDSNHHRILITGAGGQLLEAIGSGERGARDGAFEEAQFHHPQGTLFDGDMLYIADTENHLIRVADLDRRVVNTVLGTGAQARAMNAPGTGRGVALNSPWDLVAVSGKLYIAMAGSHQLWVADLKTWEARPYAGSGREEIIDGKLLEAALAQPSGITSDGKHLYFADSETSSIRMADLGPGGGVQTIVGKGLFEFGDVDGGPGRARLQHALGVAFQDGLVYLADTYNSKVKVIDPGKRTTTYAGTGKKALKNGQFQQAAFNEPGGLAWLGGKLYVADTNNHQIRVLDPPSKTVTTLEIIGLEKLARRQMDHFKGRVVDLGEKEIRPDQAQLSLSIKLPAGFRFNRDAPFFLQWKTAGARQPEQLDLKPVQFPVAVPIPKLVKPSEMTIDTVVYYCTEQSVACYVDPIRVKLALKPSAAGTAKLPIEVAVKTPPGL